MTALSETGNANVAHERRYLNYFFLEDCFELHGRLTTEDGAVVEGTGPGAGQALSGFPARVADARRVGAAVG